MNDLRFIYNFLTQWLDNDTKVSFMQLHVEIKMLSFEDVAGYCNG